MWDTELVGYTDPITKWSDRTDTETTRTFGYVETDTARIFIRIAVTVVVESVTTFIDRSDFASTVTMERTVDTALETTMADTDTKGVCGTGVAALRKCASTFVFVCHAIAIVVEVIADFVFR